MSETDSAARRRRTDGPQYPENLFGELFKVWSAAAQSFLGRTDGDGTPIEASPYGPEDVTRLWAEIVGPWMGDGQPIKPLHLPIPQTIDQQSVMTLVAQAYFAWISGGLRHSSRVAVLWNEYFRTLAERFNAAASVPGAAEIELVSLVDESRAQLRQLGELSLQEVRLVQEEMDRFAAAMRHLVDDQCPGEQRHRYWKVKP